MEANNFRLHGLDTLAGKLNVNEASSLRMNRKTVYWISQLTGWVSFAILNLILIASFDKFNLGRILVFGYLSVSGILLTHFYRIIIKKRGWINLT
ncbi:MAG: hypothetical protein ACM34O_13725, partial [Ignavibacteria bacterium]